MRDLSRGVPSSLSNPPITPHLVSESHPLMVDSVTRSPLTGSLVETNHNMGPLSHYHLPGSLRALATQLPLLEASLCREVRTWLHGRQGLPAQCALMCPRLLIEGLVLPDLPLSLPRCCLYPVDVQVPIFLKDSYALSPNHQTVYLLSGCLSTTVRSLRKEGSRSSSHN